MVLGLISAIAACPAIIGTAEAVREGQKAQAKEDHRGRDTHLVCRLPILCKESRAFDGALVVLRDGKLYIDVKVDFNYPETETEGGHPFTGFYYPYPDNQSRWKAAGFTGEGLVSTIAPSRDRSVTLLNWIFVDRTTHRVCYGGKKDVLAGDSFSGPWDCTAGERRLTFEGWEGFMAVLEEDGAWALYFDRDDDGLRGKLGSGRRVIRVLLDRREVPKSKMIADEEKFENVKAQKESDKITEIQ